jgi:hypothetical protein
MIFDLRVLLSKQSNIFNFILEVADHRIGKLLKKEQLEAFITNEITKWNR